MKSKLKKCSKCKVEKPCSEFYKNKSTTDGLNYQCKECKLEYNKKNIDKIRERAKAAWIKNQLNNLNDKDMIILKTASGIDTKELVKVKREINTRQLNHVNYNIQIMNFADLLSMYCKDYYDEVISEIRRIGSIIELYGRTDESEKKLNFWYNFLEL